jgi:hypothetical protein
MKQTFYAYLVTVLVVSACSSGKSTFERGNYYEAVITSVNRLRKNSDHKKSVETLRMAYPMAVTFYEDRANTAIASAEPFKWSQVVDAYTTINYMYDEIKRCPGALRVVPNPVNYFSKLQEARQNAAEENYAAGITALQFKERDKAKQAYNFFKAANGFVPGYKDVISYMEAALDAATVKILVEPIPVHSKTVGVSAEFFNDKISEFVHSAPIDEFVRFYTRAEAKKIKLNPDHIIQLEFDDFTVGQVYKHEKEIQLVKDSVVMGTYVTPATANQQNSDGGKTQLAGSGGLKVTGTGVVASTQNAVKNNNSTATNASTNDAAERAAKEQAEKELAEKRLAEQNAGLAAKLKAERDAAERERTAREAAEKDAAAQAAREKAEREHAEKQKAAAEAAEKARIEKENADRAAAERARLEEERRQLAEKAKADKEKADRERSEKDKAGKDAAEKAKAEKEKLVDPTIKSSDTLDVKDPVTICHVPPGNNMSRRTLVISRSALKAHLGHGDIEGTCGQDAEDSHNKQNPQNEHNKENVPPQKEEKAKPQGGTKGKGSGADNGSFKSRSDHQAGIFDHHAGQLVLASADESPASLLRYMAGTTMEADTNKVYGTVKATLYQNRKTTTAKGVVSFRIIDAKTGALLSVEKMPGEFVWASEWATFNGDERALSGEQLKLTRLKEQPAPSAQDLFIEFTRPIYDQITTKIRDFYKGY